MNDNNSRNKKIIIFIILDFIILITLVILLIFNVGKNNNSIVNSDEVNNEIIEIPNDENFKIYYNDVSSMKYINIAYKNSYFASTDELYDINGNTLLKTSNRNINYVIGKNYFYADKNIYTLDGNLFINNINTEQIYANENYIIVDKKMYYDENGNLIFDGSKHYSVSSFDGNLAVVYDENVSGATIVDLNNNPLFEGRYTYISKINDYIYKFQNDLQNTYDFYLYNSKINKIYGPVVSYEIFDNDKALVDLYNGNPEDRTFFIDKDKLTSHILNLNNLSTESSSKISACDFSDTIFNGKYLVSSAFSIDGYKYVIYDTNFKKINNGEYDKVTNLKNEYAVLSVGSKHILVNKELKELFSFEREKTSFLENRIEYDDNIFLVDSDTHSYLFDKNGKSIYISDGSLYNVHSYKNYYLIQESTEEDEKCLYLNTKTDNKIKEIDFSFCDNYYSAINQFILKEENDKYSLYDVSLKLLFNETYDDIILFKNFLLVQKEDYLSVMSYSGKKLLEDNFVDYENIDVFVKHNVVEEESAVILKKEDGSLYYFNYE